MGQVLVVVVGVVRGPPPVFKLIAPAGSECPQPSKGDACRDKLREGVREDVCVYWEATRRGSSDVSRLEARPDACLMTHTHTLPPPHLLSPSIRVGRGERRSRRKSDSSSWRRGFRRLGRSGSDRSVGQGSVKWSRAARRLDPAGPGHRARPGPAFRARPSGPGRRILRFGGPDAPAASAGAGAQRCGRPGGAW